MNHQDILISLNEPPFTIILVTTKNSNPDNFLVSLINKFTLKNFSNNLENYSDLFQCDGSISSIKKDDIITMKKQLSYSGVDDSNLKFYYLRNCENSSKETFNTLLKFIEEPNPNIIGVLTTSNINLVPITIISRCRIFYLDEDQDELHNILTKYNCTRNKWIKLLFSDINQLELFLQSSNFEKINELHNFFMNIDWTNIKNKMEQFRTLDYLNIKILVRSLLVIVENKKIDLLLNLINDLKHNPVKSLFFIKLLNVMETNYDVQ